MVDKNAILKKTIRIFTIEYLLIAAVTLVIGLLRILDVMKYSERRLLIYNILTLVGVAYIIFDLVFNLIKEKRRKKICWVDKGFAIVAAIYLLTFDILVLGKFLTDLNVIKYMVGAVLLYASAMSLFLGIYHYKYPTAQILDVVEEEYKQKVEEEQAEAEKQKIEAEKENNENKTEGE